jgi:hypothetical protein
MIYNSHTIYVLTLQCEVCHLTTQSANGQRWKPALFTVPFYWTLEANLHTQHNSTL